MPIGPKVLSHSRFLQLRDEDELPELAAHMDEASFQAGQRVFEAGDSGGTMHVVLAGKVEAFLRLAREFMERPPPPPASP